MKEQKPRKSAKNSNRPSGDPKASAAQPDFTSAATPKEAVIPAQSDAITLVEAKIDVGLGNTVYIRGEGDGLRWDAGQPLTCLGASTWVWSSRQAKDRVTFKLLLNDQIWAHGADVVVQPGTRIEVAPRF